MLTAIITSTVIIALGLIGAAIWQIRRMLSTLVKQQEALQQQNPDAYQDLSHQVSELRQTMGGVVKGLRVMGNQVNNLNTLAGYALKTAQEHMGEESDQPPQLMIELHRAGEDGEGPQTIHPDDMTPEMLEKFRSFQAVYRAILDEPGFPSRQRPDLN